MKTFKKFINESVKDLLKPKSEEELKKILEKQDIEETLLMGCKGNDKWLVDFAFENGVDINREIYKGMTYGNMCLKYATIYGHYQIAKLLIEKGVKVTIDIRSSLIEHTYGSGGKRMLNLLDKHLEKTQDNSN